MIQSTQLAINLQLLFKIGICNKHSKMELIKGWSLKVPLHSIHGCFKNVRYTKSYSSAED